MAIGICILPASGEISGPHGGGHKDVFCDVVRCSLLKIEKSQNFYETARRKIPEDTRFNSIPVITVRVFSFSESLMWCVSRFVLILPSTCNGLSFPS